MEFKRHIGKGAWAFADKSLPALWGIANIFLVQRILPVDEYAGLVVVLQIYFIVTILATSFAFQPLVKFAAERDDAGEEVAASILLSLLFYAVSALLVMLFRDPIVALLDKGGQGGVDSLYPLLFLMFAGSWYRNFAVNLLQARYEVRKVFLVDAAYFLGVPLLLILARVTGLYRSAFDVAVINVLGLFLSTAIALPATFRLLPRPLRIGRGGIRRIWDFGKFSFWGTAMYSVFAQADVFFISSYAGILAVAPYSIAKTFTRLFDMLVQVIQMFLIPFFSRNAAEGQREQMRIVSEKMICFSTVLFLPVFILLFIFPEPFLHIIYGGKFDHAAPLLRILALMIVAVPWNAVIASYLVGVGKIREGFYSNIVLMALALAGYVILTPLYGAAGAAVALVLSFSAITALLVLYVRRSLPLSPARIVRRIEDIWSFAKELRGKIVLKKG